TITNLMRLMSLEQEVQTLLEHGDLEMGHARALLGLEGRVQLDAARTAVAKGMTVRQTEALVRHLQQQQEQPEQTENHRIDPDIKRLQDKLSDQVGASVSIQHNAKGKGRLILKYNSLDELEGILDHIK
ncbi:MAG: chromosome partitioning protein ParB, partial [Porticoccus sp.]|nr:chromosome partitioning protein ParB [Porticoccus sp.]